MSSVGGAEFDCNGDLFKKERRKGVRENRFESDWEGKIIHNLTKEMLLRTAQTDRKKDLGEDVLQNVSLSPFEAGSEGRRLVKERPRRKKGVSQEGLLPSAEECLRIVSSGEGDRDGMKKSRESLKVRGAFSHRVVLIGKGVFFQGGGEKKKLTRSLSCLLVERRMKSLLLFPTENCFL